MPSTSDNVELEELAKNDSNTNECKPSSAPTARDTNLDRPTGVDRKSLFRKSTSNKKSKRKSKRKSCASLQSLTASLNPSNADLRSEPNMYKDDYHDISCTASKNSLDNVFDPSIDGSTSQYPYYMASEENFRVGGGSYSTQTSTIGFRASFFSVLEKLGMFRSQEIIKEQQYSNDNRFPSNKGPRDRSSVTSLYFRSLYGGNFNHLLKFCLILSTFALSDSLNNF